MAGFTFSCSSTGCGCFLSLFGVVLAALSAVVVLVYLLLRGRLHVLVLRHRLRVVSVFIWGGFCGCFCRGRARVSAASWAIARARARAPAAGVSLPLFEVVFAAVSAVLVLVHPLLYEWLHVLVLGHWPPVFLRSPKVRFCGWCVRSRAAVPTGSGAAAGAFTRGFCGVS